MSPDAEAERALDQTGPGRPPHEPTEATRKQVEALASFGVKQNDIAEFIGVDPHTLRKDYGELLTRAQTKANSLVAQSLFQKATGDGPAAVTAAIFWLKTRASWKETAVQEHVGKDGGPIETRNITDEDRARALAVFLARTRIAG